MLAGRGLVRLGGEWKNGMPIYCEECGSRISRIQCIVRVGAKAIEEFIPGIGADLPMEALDDGAMSGIANALTLECPACGQTLWTEVEPEHATPPTATAATAPPLSPIDRILETEADPAGPTAASIGGARCPDRPASKDPSRTPRAGKGAAPLSGDAGRATRSDGPCPGAAASSTGRATEGRRSPTSRIAGRPASKPTDERSRRSAGKDEPPKRKPNPRLDRYR